MGAIEGNSVRNEFVGKYMADEVGAHRPECFKIRENSNCERNEVSWRGALMLRLSSRTRYAVSSSRMTWISWPMQTRTHMSKS